MTRADDLGDNAALTPNDALGDVHATVPVLVRDLMVWRSRLDYTQESNATLYEIESYIPRPRLVTVNLDDVLAKLADQFEWFPSQVALANKVLEGLEKES